MTSRRFPGGDDTEEIYALRRASKRARGGKTTVVSTTEPSNPTDGLIWFNPDTGVTQVWDGTTWRDVGGVGSGGVPVPGQAFCRMQLSSNWAVVGEYPADTKWYLLSANPVVNPGEMWGFFDRMEIHRYTADGVDVSPWLLALAAGDRVEFWSPGYDGVISALVADPPNGRLEGDVFHADVASLDYSGGTYPPREEQQLRLVSDTALDVGNVPFDHVNFDSFGNMADPTNGLINAPWTGVYQVGVQLFFASTGPGSAGYFRVHRNRSNTTFPIIRREDWGPYRGGGPFATSLIAADAGDTFGLDFSGDTGGATLRGTTGGGQVATGLWAVYMGPT